MTSNSAIEQSRTFPGSLKHDLSEDLSRFNATEVIESTPLLSFYPSGTILSLYPCQDFIELFCLNFNKIVEISRT